VSVFVLPSGAVNALQVATVAALAPGVSGWIAQVEGRLQGRRGPRILQPYYDLGKLFRKESLAPEGASWLFLAAPAIAFVAYALVPLLIPVLTSYGLPLGYQGDILGGGFLLTLGGFVIATAAADTGAPYAQIGSSRAMTFAAIGEPVVLFITFTVAITTGTDLPYAEAAISRASAAELVRPGHILAGLALFMVLLAETDRIPVATHSSTIELGMLGEAREFEHSGPYLALLKWGGQVKQLVFFVLLLNLFVVPWGLAGDGSLLSLGVGILTLVAKAAGLGVVIAVIDNGFGKLRLFKITEFVAAAFLLSVLAVFTLFFGGG
jgi:formate hydrogenlyase subunit 4